MAEWGAILDRVAKEGLSQEVTFQQKSEQNANGCLGEEHCRQKGQHVQRPWAGTSLACFPSRKEATVDGGEGSWRVKLSNWHFIRSVWLPRRTDCGGKSRGRRGGAEPPPPSR